MNVKVYYIDCLTNLHVGSGDANFNIVDKEVEKDPVTGYPIVHASGIKGALREAYRKNHSEKETEKIFGKPATENESDTGGSYKFFDARFLYRPVRAQGSVPSVNVTTVEAIREFAQLTKAFGIDIGLDTGVLDKI
ncbi:MAG: type III-B CRISPR module RAMP protein Cmr4, partial [Clostridia bacterium]|nr:type III-B CRISPR module RAMP protein Cmr4 [Clostridia bacterium]